MTNLAPLAAAFMRAATARHMRLEPGAHVHMPPAPDRPLLLRIHVPLQRALGTREQMRVNLSAEWEDERAAPAPGAEALDQAR